MPRAHRLGLLTTAVVIAYLLAWYGMFAVPGLDSKTSDQILPVLPWWALITLGSYSLWSIGMGLLTLRECPEAYEELLGEIAEAKNELRAKGVTVD